MADDLHLTDSFSLLKGDFDGFDQAMAIVRSQYEAIEHDLKAGLAVFRQCDVIVEVEDLVAAAFNDAVRRMERLRNEAW